MNETPAEGPSVEPQTEPGPTRNLPPWIRRGAVAFGGVAVLAGAALIYRAEQEPEPVASTAEARPRVENHTVILPETFARRLGIQVSPIEETKLSPVVRAWGTVAFDPQHVGASGTRARGFVKRVLHYEGDRVEKGEPLAEIESAELGHARAELTALTARAETAKNNAEREAALLRQNLTTAREEEVARAEYEDVKASLWAARHRLTVLGSRSGDASGSYTLVAPIAGTVVVRAISPGQTVEGELLAFQVADLSHFWVELTLYEKEVGTIHVGDPVRVWAPGQENAAHTGKVIYVGEVVDPLSRSAKVRVALEENGPRMRPGQAVQAEIRPQSLALTAPLVPSSAVTYVDGAPTVFVDRGNHHYEVRKVTLGKTEGASSEVVAGLKPGERVVTASVFKLKSELFR